jgi:hypothetical protein
MAWLARRSNPGVGQASRMLRPEHFALVVRRARPLRKSGDPPHRTSAGDKRNWSVFKDPFRLRQLNVPESTYSTRLTMRLLWLTRSVVLPLLLVGLACARNNESNNTAAAAQDTTNTAISDSARANQTESGMTDSTGQSTLGPGAEKTRPDQGQPVTSKGDTVNAGVDSSTTPR